MAEGFEPYHVPQQSRRDKLRVNNQPGCVDHHFSSNFYDPSLISPDLINSAAHLHRQSYSLGPNGGGGVKEGGMNLMGFLGGMNINHMYVDPQMSAQLNPSSIQDINGNPPPPPCVYSSSAAAAETQYYRGVLDDQASFHGNSSNGNGQSLSLSLSSHQGHHHHHLPLELNLQQRYNDSSPPTMFGENNKVSEGGSYVVGNNCKTTTGFTTSIDQLSKSFVPLGPFTGYASVLKGSRFLKPAQQLLEELCDVGRGFYSDRNYVSVSSVFLDPPPLESLSHHENGGVVVVDDSINCSSDGGEQTRKKSRLLSMLDEVYKRYKQYYQQMQTAVAAFESVAGLSNASPFANLALKALSKHFRCLKNAITDQLHFTSKPHGKLSYERDDGTQIQENSGRGSFVQRQFRVDPPTWRPQRGLPEHAVTVLRAWLFEHFLHPYPTDTDKLMLAKQTGLSRNQVSNWFINARVRLWKPMVEEIHTLETHQGQKPNNNNNSQRDEQQQQTSKPNDHPMMPIIDECENASTSMQRIGEFSLKRTREAGPAETRQGNEVGQMRSPYTNLMHNSSSPRLHVGGGGVGGVSLTLGLHQNGVGLGESYPMHAARRLGLDSHGEGYPVSRFAADQNRQFGRDVMDGQMMHDFVG